ncbi:MAG: ribonuclease HI family protein [Deltaproteobacteria bacterium]|jgi:ribonuclease HI|nr:ribonuclease HI family protein [Deltaproteobacteria bacterium]
MKKRAVTVRSDGASRGNPGPSGIGVVLEVDGEDCPIERFEYIGEATNNVAEYRALLLGLSEAEKLSPSSLTILSDSELIVRQLNAEYRVKSDLLKPLYLEACRRLRGFPGTRILHIDRGENQAADRLANRAIDAHFQKA